MAKLASKVQSALDETRMLILGAQILIGFAFRAFFEPAFEELPAWARAAELCALVLLLAAFAVLVAPSPYHRLAAGGDDTPRLHRVTTRCADLALAPFAVALALAVSAAAARVEALGTASAVACGAATATVALGAWYAYPRLRRRPPTAGREEEDEGVSTPIDRKIRHVLTEARMVLPGAQALLGFQLAGTLMEAFAKLPAAAQLLHLGDIALTALAVVLLMAPAAYHRLAEHGEETERFHGVASRFVLAALAPLALGMAGELAIVAWKVADSVAAAAALAGGAILLFAAAWLAFPVAARLAARRRAAAPVTP